MKLKLSVCLLALVALSAAAWAKPKPITAKAQLAFGVDMAERGLWSEALFRFKQAERLGGRGAAVYNNMAVAYEALGVFEKAREYYLRALDADPSDSSLKRNYSRFVEFYQSFNAGEESEEAEGEGEKEDSPEESSDPASGW